MSTIDTSRTLLAYLRQGPPSQRPFADIVLPAEPGVSAFLGREAEVSRSLSGMPLPGKVHVTVHSLGGDPLGKVYSGTGWYGATQAARRAIDDAQRRGIDVMPFVSTAITHTLFELRCGRYVKDECESIIQSARDEFSAIGVRPEEHKAIVDGLRELHGLLSAFCGGQGDDSEIPPAADQRAQVEALLHVFGTPEDQVRFG
jgi:hypothetical protein